MFREQMEVLLEIMSDWDGIQDVDREAILKELGDRIAVKRRRENIKPVE